jgi:hypothetical protein
MIIKTIINKKVGKKVEITKHEENRYSIKYYEYFKNGGWKSYMPAEYCDKDYIKFNFGIEL